MYSPVVSRRNVSAIISIALFYPVSVSAQGISLSQTFDDPTVTDLDNFGASVAIDGNRVLIGARQHGSGGMNFEGQAHLFDASTGALLQTFNNPNNVDPIEQFGTSVAIDGNHVLIGASSEFLTATGVHGQAHLFDATTGALLQTFDDPTPTASDHFGSSVAIDGTNVLIGARRDNSNGGGVGQAHLFNASTGALLQTFNDPTITIGDNFGVSVAIDRDHVLIGASFDDTNLTNGGQAHLFSASTGALLQTFDDPVGPFGDAFGASVAIDNGRVLVGAPEGVGTGNNGEAHLFDATTGALLHTFNDPTPSADDRFGESVAIQGSRILIGARGDDTNGNNVGQAHLFDTATGALLQTLNDPTITSSDAFGVSVALDGGAVFIGARGDDTNGTSVGQAHLFNISPSIIVDPGSLGAIDVVSDPTGATTTVTNPVAIPFNAPSLAIGDTSDGELLVEGTAVASLSGRIFIGRTAGADGVLTVSGGATVSNTGAFIGDNPGSSGAVTVTGPGSTWTNSDFLDVGNDGDGTLDVLDGGVVTSDRAFIGQDPISTGVATVDGPGSRWEATGEFNIGDFGDGTLNVTNGGEVRLSSAADAFIGHENGSEGELTVSGPSSSFTDGNDLYVGFAGQGTLTVTAGGSVSMIDDTEIGLNAASSGSVIVRGVGSSLESGGRLLVGGSGNGSLSVEEGATVTSVSGLIGTGANFGPSRVVFVDGAGSSWTMASQLDIGGSTTARLEITNGGSVTADGFSVIGAVAGSDGEVTVHGSQSTWTTGADQTVGFNGDASLSVENGAVVTAGVNGYVGRFTGANGTATVGGAGDLASWELANDLYIAGTVGLSSASSQDGSGSGTLNVESNGQVMVAGEVFLKDRGVINLNGGELIANDLVFQDFLDRDLSPTVNFNSGKLRYMASKTLTDEELAVLFGGGPQVLSPGQHLAIDGLAELPTDSDPNTYRLRINGGELSFGVTSNSSFAEIDFDAGRLNIGGAGFVVSPTGLFGSTLTIDADQVINTPAQINIDPGSLLTVSGGQLSAQVSSNLGTLVVAQGSAAYGDRLNNQGDVVLIDAVVEGQIDNAGDLTIVNGATIDDVVFASTGLVNLQVATASGVSALTINDDAVLDGGLNVTAGDLSGVSVGDEFDLLNALGSIAGVFAAENLPTIGGGLEFNVVYESNRVALFVAGVAGDYNFDGVVNAADYTVFRDSQGQTGTGLAADGDLDGDVDADDYAVWATNYGTTAIAPTVSIPEPGSATLAIFAYTALLRSRRRAR